MLHESAHVRVSAEHGTATLWLDFPGEPVNALDAARLGEIDAALRAVAGNPYVRILVVRSAKPAGFCAGIHPAALASLATDADRAAFAGAGQRVLDRLAGLDAVTLAVLDGPCLGAGLELALACDHRLCVSRPTTHLGFPDASVIPPGFGGSVRLRHRIGRRRAEQLLTSGRTLSGREARALGLVDHAYCERRAKIELRTFLDRLERTGRLPRRSTAVTGFAGERRAFARALGSARAQAAIAEQLDALRPLHDESPTNPLPPFPAVVGLLGEGEAASRLGADVALRGGEVVVCGSGTGVFRGIAAALARGFVTPLEADQAKSRVKASPTLAGFDRVGLVLISESESPDDLADVIRPRCLVVTAPAFALINRYDPDALATLAAWLKPFSVNPGVAEAVPDADLVAA